MMLGPRKAGRIDAALAPAHSCRGACASNLAVDKEVNTWGHGGRVGQRRLDGKKIQTKKNFPKTKPILGTLSVPNPNRRLVPRLVHV